VEGSSGSVTLRALPWRSATSAGGKRVSRSRQWPRSSTRPRPRMCSGLSRSSTGYSAGCSTRVSTSRLPGRVVISTLPKWTQRRKDRSSRSPDQLTFQFAKKVTLDTPELMCALVEPSRLCHY
jgi:hypothetical protein